MTQINSAATVADAMTARARRCGTRASRAPGSRRAAALLAVASVLLAPFGTAFSQDAGQPRLKTVELSVGMHRIVAEVALSPREQQLGLMFRERMAPQEGMLFVYDAPAMHCFWMRNTVLPLTIAFVDERGVIVDLQDMQPQTDDSHCSAKPARFALEMNQGWFAKRHLGVGSRVRGAPFVP